MNTSNEHEEDRTPGWLQLVLFPFMLVAYIRQVFASQAEQLKAKRRTHALPTDWDDPLPDLETTERLISAMTAEGARRIFAGEALDLDTLTITDPAPNQLWIPPGSAEQMHLRVLAMNRFLADPERFIHRHAARIARRAAEQGAATTTTKPAPAPEAPGGATTTATTAAATRARAGIRVRAPP